MSDFHTYIIEDLFREIDGIISHRMFGGYGIYKDGVMFALITNEVLYFKVDDGNRANYEKLKSNPFTYKRREGKEIRLSFWEVPDLIMDDSTLLPLWIDAAVKAAHRAKQVKKKKDVR